MKNERTNKRTYRIFKDSNGEWRWNLSSSNGNVIRCSGEGYKNKSDCWDMMVDDQRGEYYFRVIEVDAAVVGVKTFPQKKKNFFSKTPAPITEDEIQFKEILLFDMEAPLKISSRITITENLIEEKMLEIRSTSDKAHRQTLWNVVEYLKGVLQGLKEKAEPETEGL